MAKKDRDKDQDDANDQSKKDEKAAGSNRHESFCPRCQVWYPSNDSSHAGH